MKQLAFKFRKAFAHWYLEYQDNGTNHVSFHPSRDKAFAKMLRIVLAAGLKSLEQFTVVLHWEDKP